MDEQDETGDFRDRSAGSPSSLVSADQNANINSGDGNLPPDISLSKASLDSISKIFSARSDATTLPTDGVTKLANEMEKKEGIEETKSEDRPITARTQRSLGETTNAGKAANSSNASDSNVPTTAGSADPKISFGSVLSAWKLTKQRKAALRNRIETIPEGSESSATTSAVVTRPEPPRVQTPVTDRSQASHRVPPTLRESHSRANSASTQNSMADAENDGEFTQDPLEEENPPDAPVQPPVLKSWDDLHKPPTPKGISDIMDAGTPAPDVITSEPDGPPELKHSHELPNESDLMEMDPTNDTEQAHNDPVPKASTAIVVPVLNLEGTRDSPDAKSLAPSLTDTQHTSSPPPTGLVDKGDTTALPEQGKEVEDTQRDQVEGQSGTEQQAASDQPPEKKRRPSYSQGNKMLDAIFGMERLLAARPRRTPRSRNVDRPEGSKTPSQLGRTWTRSELKHGTAEPDTARTQTPADLIRVGSSKMKDNALNEVSEKNEPNMEDQNSNDVPDKNGPERMDLEEDNANDKEIELPETARTQTSNIEIKAESDNLEPFHETAQPSDLPETPASEADDVLHDMNENVRDLSKIARRQSEDFNYFDFNPNPVTSPSPFRRVFSPSLPIRDSVPRPFRDDSPEPERRRSKTSTIENLHGLTDTVPIQPINVPRSPRPPPQRKAPGRGQKVRPMSKEFNDPAKILESVRRSSSNTNSTPDTQYTRIPDSDELWSSDDTYAAFVRGGQARGTVPAPSRRSVTQGNSRPKDEKKDQLRVNRPVGRTLSDSNIPRKSPRPISKSPNLSPKEKRRRFKEPTLNDVDKIQEVIEYETGRRRSLSRPRPARYGAGSPSSSSSSGSQRLFRPSRGVFRAKQRSLEDDEVPFLARDVDKKPLRLTTTGGKIPPPAAFRPKNNAIRPLTELERRSQRREPGRGVPDRSRSRSRSPPKRVSIIDRGAPIRSLSSSPEKVLNEHGKIRSPFAPRKQRDKTDEAVGGKSGSPTKGKSSTSLPRSKPKEGDKDKLMKNAVEPNVSPPSDAVGKGSPKKSKQSLTGGDKGKAQPPQATTDKTSVETKPTGEQTKDAVKVGSEEFKLTKPTESTSEDKVNAGTAKAGEPSGAANDKVETKEGADGQPRELTEKEKAVARRRAIAKSRLDASLKSLKLARDGEWIKLAEILKDVSKNQIDFTLHDENGYTVLHHAAQHGKNNAIERMMQLGANLNQQTKEGMTALHLAALHNTNDETIKYLIEKHNADPNRPGGPKGQLPLHIVCARQGPAVLPLLHTLMRASTGKDKTIDPRVLEDKTGATPLLTAIDAGNQWVSRDLLSTNPEKQIFTVQRDTGNTALHLACKAKDLELVRELIDMGADVNARNNEGRTALHIVAENGAESILRILYQARANANIADKEDKTPLHLAAEFGHTAIVEILTDKFKASVLARTKDGSTLMHIASRNGHPETAIAFLQRGVPLHMPNKAGWLGLHSAAACGHVHVIRTLLHKGANVDSRTKDGLTALHIAVQNNKPASVECLLGYGSSVQLKTYQAGETPLHLAANLEGPVGIKCAEMLLKSGAENNVLTEGGETAMHIAARNGNTAMMNLLLEDGGNPALLSKAGESSLHVACRHCYFNVADMVVKMIQKRKKREDAIQLVNTQNQEGESAVHYACEILHNAAHYTNEDVDIIKMLLNYDGDIGARTYLVSAHYTNEDVDIIKMLLNYDGDIGARTHLVSAHYTNEDVDIIKLLLNYDGDIGARTYLVSAHYTNEDVDIIKLLLNYDGDIGART